MWSLLNVELSRWKVIAANYQGDTTPSIIALDKRFVQPRALIIPSIFWTNPERSDCKGQVQDIIEAGAERAKKISHRSKKSKTR